MRGRCKVLLTMLLGLAGGCVDSTGPSVQAIRVVPLVDLRLTGYRNTDVAALPALRVYDANTGEAVAGKVFKFTIETPLVGLESFSVTTGADGVATMPAWRIGQALGRYTVTALTDGWGPVVFTLLVPGDVVGVYDLKLVNGFVRPALEERIVLYEAGLFNRFPDVATLAFTPAELRIGTYSRLPGDTIQFSMSCVSSLGRCFPWGAMGTVSGSSLTIDESDWYGPFVKTYELNAGVMSR